MGREAQPSVAPGLPGYLVKIARYPLWAISVRALVGAALLPVPVFLYVGTRYHYFVGTDAQYHVDQNALLAGVTLALIGALVGMMVGALWAARGPIRAAARTRGPPEKEVIRVGAAARNRLFAQYVPQSHVNSSVTNARSRSRRVNGCTRSALTEPASTYGRFHDSETPEGSRVRECGCRPLAARPRRIHRERRRRGAPQTLPLSGPRPRAAVAAKRLFGG
jgi:hypothetical protein